ncbi:hypothetical protein MPER_06881 [Moniliophthora perniciosa FA553]|nr:hypothetical protein MPER_06881 [Moniliophthora perniciosa FA553]
MNNIPQPPELIVRPVEFRESFLQGPFEIWQFVIERNMICWMFFEVIPYFLNENRCRWVGVSTWIKLDRRRLE